MDNKFIETYREKSRKLQKLRAEYKRALINGNTPSQDSFREIVELDAELKKIDASVGSSTKHIDKYNSKQ